MALSALWYGRFEFAFGAVVGDGLVVEAGIGEPAETLVEEREQERDLHTFGGTPIGVSTAITLEESVAFQLAQIVAELVQSVSLR
jgi:hypothetical protein